MVTGIYTGPPECYEEAMAPMLKLKPEVNLKWDWTYLEAARHFTTKSFPPPFFKNKSTFVQKQLPDDGHASII